MSVSCVCVPSQKNRFPVYWRLLVQEHIAPYSDRRHMRHDIIKKCFFFLSVSVRFGIGATIRTRWEIQCLLYAGIFFFKGFIKVCPALEMSSLWGRMSYFLGSFPWFVEAGEAWGTTTLFQRLMFLPISFELNTVETWGPQVKDAPEPNILPEMFRKL